MTAPEINFSELVNKPRDAVRKVHRSPSRSVHVRRRGADEEDLVLVTANRADQDRQALSLTTRLFVELMKHDDRMPALVTEIIPAAFPWVRFLPAEGVREFVVELVGVLQASEALMNPAPLVQLITDWRHTAEVYADPELLAILSRDHDGDFGPVPEPRT